MKNTDLLASKIKKFTGKNPFTESQVRDTPLQKLKNQFVPTSKFWDRFNVSNEILIGTRGSGKTILLRMLSYSALVSMKKGPFKKQFAEALPSDDVQFIGFYIPLRLRILKEIGTIYDKTDISKAGEDTEQIKRKEREEQRRFSFLFNCVSASSILDEVSSIIEDHFSDAEALLKEREIIDKLKEAWEVASDKPTSTIKSFQEQIDRLYDDIRKDWEFERGHNKFDTALLEPVISAIPIINNALGFDKQNTMWMACFDEAEYLNKNLQRVLNTIMRSESRGLAVKIATLPFHYTEYRTEVDGEFVQPEGDDFRFESIDYSWTDDNFVKLADYLVATRLAETRLFDEIPESNSLESFVGSSKDIISLYRGIFKNEDDDEIDRKVMGQLQLKSGKKSQHYDLGQIKRYKPIYLLRELYKQSRKGNSKVPRLSGELMIRRVSEGNVRRLIQICDKIFESSRAQFSTPNTQNEAVMSFSKQRFERSQSVYRDGFLLYELLQAISEYLFQKFHNGLLMDVGVEFTVTDDLLENEKVKSALEMGVAYSYLTCSKTDLFNGISSSTKFRLANSVAAYKWLPMRAGIGTKISRESGIVSFLFEENIIKPKVKEQLSSNLTLDFFDE